MKLKYLSVCLFSLSFGGCTHYVTKPNLEQNQQLEQRATDALNAIFESPSYDFSGQLSIETDTNQKVEKKEKTVHKPKAQLDPEVKKQVDSTLKSLNVKLTSKEKDQLYKNIAEQNNPYAYLEELLGSSDTGNDDSKMNSFLNLLNDLQFSYDGSVHYRQKMASLNLNMKYEKPTLQVQAKLPMVVDFKDHKFYTNYFALMPFLVNKESQASYAYIDFSKYKDEFEKLNTKKFVEYLKQTNALPYVLASEQDVNSQRLTQQDIQNGLSEKIRLNTDVETLMLQVSLYEWVNKPFISQEIMGKEYDPSSEQNEEDDAFAVAKEAAEAADAAAVAAADAQAYAADEDDVYEQAYESASRVSRLIEAEQYGEESEVEAAYDDADEEDEANQAVAAAAEATGYDEESQTLDMSYDECEELIDSKKRFPIGQVNFCSNYYGIDVLKKDAKSEQAEEAESEDHLEKLKEVFTVYQSDKLVSAHEFKALWLKHQNEITQALNKQYKKRSPLIADVGLDQKGRVQDLVYDISKYRENDGKIRFLSKTQFLNYGQATPIDQKQLKQAKTIEDVARGSIAERITSGITRSLKIDEDMDATAAVDESEETKHTLSFEEQLDEIALQTYKKTGSYLKTYQAVFLLLYSARNPDVMKYYSSADMNEIAELHAYEYMSDLEKPKGKALERLNKLAKKHALTDSESFGNVGNTAAVIVEDSIGELKDEGYWKKLMSSSKNNPAVAFAQHYQKLYREDYDVDEDQEQDLVAASKVLAQAYVDDRKDKLSKNSIKAFKSEHYGLIDYDVYRATYIAVQQRFAK